VVDAASFRIDAFLLETKIENIAVGNPARIRLMATGEVLTGQVRGISTGSSFAEDMSTSLLQAPQPSFQWIRLGQRIPVEISLDAHPARLALVNGMTATVIVENAARRE
jgi:multidrug resistance efflux pump